MSAERRGPFLFRLADRGIVAVTGADRVRWLDGMLTNEVRTLSEGPERSGAHALLLTRQGRIVADLHVLLRGEAFWLETARQAVPTVSETLERFVIADRVEIADLSAAWERLALEGPGAPDVISAATGGAPPLRPDACIESAIDGETVVVAAYGLAAPDGRQVFAPAGAGERVAAALERAGASSAAADAFETLRIESGIPRMFAELDEGVLPAEARLTHTVSFTKGCFTGQEVVARMESRGRVGHLLVGLAFPDASDPPAPGSAIVSGGRKLGEVTSSVRSPAAGPIALGYVRSGNETPGTEVEVGDLRARVVELPFVGSA